MLCYDSKEDNENEEETFPHTPSKEEEKEKEERNKNKKNKNAHAKKSFFFLLSFLEIHDSFRELLGRILVGEKRIGNKDIFSAKKMVVWQNFRIFVPK